MSGQRNPWYWLERKAWRKTGYPIASVAYYGPDDALASKVVVGIVPSAQDRDVTELRKWHSDRSDVRTDPAIGEEILAFLAEHQVQRVAMVDRIIGCPHEEGVDYPEGERCPQCQFWADRDRWTGKPVR